MLNENTDLKVFEIDNLDLDDNNYSYFEKKKLKNYLKIKYLLRYLSKNYTQYK